MNCRILPGVSPAAVVSELTKVLADSAIDVSLVDEATPSQPAALRPDVMSAVEAIAKSMFPDVPVVPVMGTGATDSLYLRNAGIPTLGVDGLFDDIDDVRAHGRDERVGVKQFFEDLEFHYRLITMLATPLGQRASCLNGLASHPSNATCSGTSRIALIPKATCIAMARLVPAVRTAHRGRSRPRDARVAPDACAQHTPVRQARTSSFDSGGAQPLGYPGSSRAVRRT